MQKKKKKISCSSPGRVGVLKAENISLLMCLYQERSEIFKRKMEECTSIL